ncbi:YycH family regulatory protein [Paenibacillus sp. NPDC056579]|uniref:YycH family regulatory protein n=1 Tax=unclassified Paenibacillus TaxID=185978 RepID=UPI001EF78DD0|nr:two-component system activity regulator YycH [Paenibacillus sp. H1-7]ULL13039.1 hypothetical protein DVH26_00205 [Paenibacillus sp. H1-7]
MIEKVKTGLLVMLVAVSLMQSYFLSYSSPKFDPLEQQDYVKTDPIGTQAKLEDLLFPDQVVLHMGNQVHTVLYPNTAPYNQVLDSVKQRTLSGFRKTTVSALNMNVEEVRGKQQGIEVVFRDGIPISVLHRVMQMKGDLPLDNDTITRIWIIAREAKDEVRTILFTDTASTVYEVQKADISAKDIERLMAIEGTVPYKAVEGDYYLPTKPVSFPGYSFGFSQFTVDQLKRSFFVDPAITRNLSERDGTEIYTDAKRGLQLKNDERWLIYSDPVASVDAKIDVEENLLSAVQFVNQHGGWNGQYTVQKVPQRLLPVNQAFIFRQYYGSLPIINQRNDNIGFIKMVLQKGVVSSYERSMIIPEPQSATSKEVAMLFGDALDAKLNQYAKKSAVISVFPGYRPTVGVGEDRMRLDPSWVVELRDGTYEFLE